MKRLQSVASTMKTVQPSSFPVSMTKPSSPVSFPLTLSHLAQNPFMCDCHLKWLADYLFDNPIETSGARCSHPRRLANKRISQVKGKKFRCTGRTRVHSLAPSTPTYSHKHKQTHKSICSHKNTHAGLCVQLET